MPQQTKIPSVEIVNLLNLSLALSNAVESRFMAPDHGAAIWKKFLKSTAVDVIRVTKDEVTTSSVKGVQNAS
jgi:hypothetical protein